MTIPPSPSINRRAPNHRRQRYQIVRRRTARHGVSAVSAKRLHAVRRRRRRHRLRRRKAATLLIEADAPVGISSSHSAIAASSVVA